MKDEAREDWIRKKLETYLKDLAQFSQEEGKMTRLPFTQAAIICMMLCRRSALQQ